MQQRLEKKHWTKSGSRLSSLPALPHGLMQAPRPLQVCFSLCKRRWLHWVLSKSLLAPTYWALSFLSSPGTRNLLVKCKINRCTLRTLVAEAEYSPRALWEILTFPKKSA